MNAADDNRRLGDAWAIWCEHGDVTPFLAVADELGVLNADLVRELLQDAAGRDIDVTKKLADKGWDAAALRQQPPKRTALAAQPLPNVVVAQNDGWPKTLTKEDYMQWTRLCEAPWHYKLCELAAPLSYRRIAMGILRLAIEEGNRNVNLSNRRLRTRLGAKSTTISDAIAWLVDNGFLTLVSSADRAKRHATIYRLSGMGAAGTLPRLPLEVTVLGDLGVEIVARALADGCSANPSALARVTGLPRRTCERALAKLPALTAVQ